MSNLGSMLRGIHARYKEILTLTEELPPQYKRWLKASVRASNFAIGLVPGGAVVTLVSTYLQVNDAKRVLESIIQIICKF